MRLQAVSGATLAVPPWIRLRRQESSSFSWLARWIAKPQVVAEPAERSRRSRQFLAVGQDVVDVGEAGSLSQPHPGQDGPVGAGVLGLVVLSGRR